MDPVEPHTTDTTDRDKIANKIEKAAKRLEGITRESFIDDRSICTSCRWATIIRRSSQNVRRIRCGELSEYVPGDITECNSYANLTALSLGQMAEIAVLIDNHDPTRVGFHI